MQNIDKVLVVATARAVYPEQLAEGIAWIQEKGFRLELGANLYKSYNMGYTYAGTKEERLADLQWAFDHPTAKAIWCAAGGYGTMQLLDDLDWTTFKKSPKWVCGYSDITALHLAMAKKQLPSIHSTVIKPISDVHYVPDTQDSLLRILKGKKPIYTPPTHALNRSGDVIAPVLGGNLSLLYSALGTDWNLPTKPFILFIEDWYENWYHLDRMLHALRSNPIWNCIVGLVVGSFTRMDVAEENKNYKDDFDETSYRIIAAHFAEQNIPQLYGFSAGHIGRNLAFPLGVKTKLDVTEKHVALDFNGE